jgi:CheY-like chemotaxis protein
MRVLVVDAADNRDSLALLLSCWGHEVALAGDARSAILQAPTFQPHAVLSELALPDVDGWQLARWLRQQKRDRRLLLVAIIYYSRRDDPARSKEAGFDYFLHKPANPPVLQEILSQWEQLEPDACDFALRMG